VFRHFDRDRSGTIDDSELQSALNQFDMKLPQHLLSLLVAKFGTYTDRHALARSVQASSDPRNMASFCFLRARRDRKADDHV
jgi:Ca2+-binding EF-hand superfamily protein